MSGALETATGKRIRMIDTFLWYLLLASGPWSLLQLVPDSSGSGQDADMGEAITLLLIFIVVCFFVSILLHATYCAIIQKKLNSARGLVS